MRTPNTLRSMINECIVDYKDHIDHSYLELSYKFKGTYLFHALLSKVNTFIFVAEEITIKVQKSD